MHLIQKSIGISNNYTNKGTCFTRLAGEGRKIVINYGGGMLISR